MKTPTKTLLLAAGLLMAATAPTPAAQLRLSDGTPQGTITISDQDPLDQNPELGTITYDGPVGTNWYLTVTTGSTKPALGMGSAQSPYIDLGTFDFSSRGGGTLTVTFTETNYLGAGNFTADIGGITAGSVTYSTYQDPANQPFATTIPLSKLGPIYDPSFDAVTSGTLTATGPYSLTVQAVLVHLGAGHSGLDAELSITSSVPTINCLAPLTLDCAGAIPTPATNYTDFVAQGGSASSGCPGALTLAWLGDVLSASNCPNQFALARNYQVTDACGNSASCTQSITVNDTNAPIITCPGDKVLACGDSTDPSNTGTATAVDNCGGTVTITYADNPTPANCTGKAGIDRTWTASDACGNAATCVQHITFADSVAPVITSFPADLTVSCASDVPPANDSLVAATDNCGGAVTITHDADVITPGSCVNQYVITRTYHASDACNNVASKSQKITVSDQTAPVITSFPADLTVSCASDVPPANDSQVAATDNCGGSVTITHDADAIAAGSCANQYVITRTYHASDACNNVASKSQKITVSDQTAPVITSFPADLTVSCASQVPPANDSLVAATDNCGGAVTITHDADVITPGSCVNQYVITRTYHASDACNNVASKSQKITVSDQTAPVISSFPADLTVSCASDVPPANDSLVAATDNCGGAVTITHDADVIVAGSCANQYVITRTYHASDACNNMASKSQKITVSDQTAPVIASFPADLTVSCASQVPPANDASVLATDNCGGAVTITHDADVVTSGSCANRFVITRTYHASDACNNVASKSQKITVSDQTAPIITCIPANVTVSCAGQVPPANDAAVVATDNCGGTPVITHSDQTVSGTCANKFVLKRTYTATDACGNSSSLTQTITVNDTNAPVFVKLPSATATYQCYSDVPAMPTLTATDACGGLVVVGNSQTESNPGSSCNNVITRTWTAKDMCGNTATATQRITVNDTLPPTICCPPDIFTNLSASGQYCCQPGCGSLGVVVKYGSITATDNCSTVTLVANPPSGSTFSQGTTTVTLTAIDACGNASSCTFKVHVGGGFTTYTPGGWGAVPNGNNVASILKKWFSTVYPKGLLVGGNNTMLFTSQLAVQNYLPAGGTPGVLKQKYTNPLSTTSGVFGNQVTALKLNVDFSNAGILPKGFANLKVAPGYPLAGQTVAQVLALANQVLGGATWALPAGVSVSDLNNLISGINQNFDGGTQDLGYLTN